VNTCTDEILHHRKLLVELYLARSPNARKIKELAAELGVGEPRYGFQETHNCIVCGLCIRACNEIVGASAIGFAQRGMKRKVEPPFRRGSAACISCGTCTTICPTEAITLKEIDQLKSVHVVGEEGAVGRCSVCAEFEVVPTHHGDYAGWLSEKISGKSSK
jgi:predicted molibdopterin-dependent oxidoreductase YjgC